jgi:hypothetical protein
MRRFWFLLAAITAAIIVPGAQATRPTFIPVPAISFTDTTCGFEMSVQGSAGQTAKVFSNGTVIVTGPLTATVSANGKTLTLSIPGPFVAINGHTVFGLGRGLSAIQLPSGQITFALVAGQVDLSAFPTLLHGTVLLDVCAALAP